MLALGGEVALAADRFVCRSRLISLPAPATGRQPRPVGAERRDHQAQRKLVAHWRELGVQARVAVHLPRRLCRVGVDLEVRRRAAQGLLDFFRAGAGGNGKSTGNSWAACRCAGRETHQSQSLRAVLNERDQAQRFGFTAFVGLA